MAGGGEPGGFVLLVAVKPCTFPTLSDHIRRCELFGIPADAARLRFREFMGKREVPTATAFRAKRSPSPTFRSACRSIFWGREDSLAAIELALGRYEGRVAITALHGLRGVALLSTAGTAQRGCSWRCGPFLERVAATSSQPVVVNEHAQVFRAIRSSVFRRLLGGDLDVFAAAAVPEGHSVNSLRR